ncbi:methylmalonyl-CoA mutase family protein [Robiginitalea sp. SC105]|uniref:methylmalonyl-CoA mutase family protein n=1 Tax=Robiginitalea sp. SC105 TaxID=2762332 RepID=UPI00163A8904|nr:methylmalonyl-CoA mutase family protein [Robiginitalea sp. SC105]MBC2839243.1 methylmalonyl-CoA mutase [Robiginitalea sp. SC105]
MTTNELFEGFPPVSAAAWKLQIQAGLRGEDYNEQMTRTTPEGIRIKPFYTAEDLPPADRARLPLPAGWKAGMLLVSGDGEAAERARKAIEGGISLFLVRVEGPAEWLGGLGADAGPFWLEWPDVHLDPESVLPGSLGGDSVLLPDPIGTLAETGNWSRGKSADLGRLQELCRQWPQQLSLSIRADHYQQAGAHAVQQLAYAMSHIQEYVLQAQEHPELLPALENPVFRVAVGGDYFMEIAKIRALRRLWILLAAKYELPGACRVIAVPSLRNKTLYDYNTNLLRTTLECMAAAVGGADLICNQPYDTLYQQPNDFADRIGRNQLLILREEAHFSRVSNPADGSFYLESLTDQLGRKSLELFKNLEKGGGFLVQLKALKIQEKIREAAKKEQDAFDAGDLQLVGSNVFPNPADQMAGELQKEVFPRKSGKTLLEPLLLRRLTARYEQKRLKDEPR